MVKQNGGLETSSTHHEILEISYLSRWVTLGKMLKVIEYRQRIGKIQGIWVVE
jgi:hypothetical protein